MALREPVSLQDAIRCDDPYNPALLPVTTPGSLVPLKGSTRSRRGCCRGRVLGAVSSLGTEGLEPTRESQNTQSPRLHFRALLTEAVIQGCNFTESEVRPWCSLGTSPLRSSVVEKPQATATGQTPQTPHLAPPLRQTLPSTWPPTRTASRTPSYPASARPSRALMSLTTMWRFLSSTAPNSLSLENARVTATRLQPIIVPICS